MTKRSSNIVDSEFRTGLFRCARNDNFSGLLQHYYRWKIADSIKTVMHNAMTNLPDYVRCIEAPIRH